MHNGASGMPSGSQPDGALICGIPATPFPKRAGDQLYPRCDCFRRGCGAGRCRRGKRRAGALSHPPSRIEPIWMSNCTLHKNRAENELDSYPWGFLAEFSFFYGIHPRWNMSFFKFRPVFYPPGKPCEASRLLQHPGGTLPGDPEGRCLHPGSAKNLRTRM